MRYFDPSYQVRSRAAKCKDALLCDLFARNTVHTAMAGKTGVVIGFIHERFIHVPIELLTTHTKRPGPSKRLVALCPRRDQPTRTILT